MGRIAAVLLLFCVIAATIIALEWLGVIAALIAVVGLVALVIIVIVASAVFVAVVLSIPYYFLTRKMEVKDGSFTLDRIEEKK